MPCSEHMHMSRMLICAMCTMRMVHLCSHVPAGAYALTITSPWAWPYGGCFRHSEPSSWHVAATRVQCQMARFSTHMYSQPP